METLQWNTEKRKLGDLVPATYNPRKLSKKSYDDLKKSLEKFGLAEIPAINKDNTIMAGHMRIQLMVDLYGRDYEIDVRVPNRQLTPDEEKEYNIRSNKNTGDWDWDVMANNFNPDELMDWGFNDYELSFYEHELGELSMKGSEVSIAGLNSAELNKITFEFNDKDYFEILKGLNVIKSEKGFDSNEEVLKYLLSSYV